MQKIVIIGTGISAEVFYDVIQKDDRYDLAAFAVEKEYIKENTLFDYEVCDINTLPDKYPNSEYKVLMAVGYGNINRNREKLFNMVKEMGYEAITYIHPSAQIFTDKIGEGTVILANAVIEPYTSIGSNSVIWSNSCVAHHSTVGNNCWIATGAVISGNAKIEDNSFLGVNTTIVNDITVAKLNIIGAGALITKTTHENEVYLTRQAEKFRFSSTDYIRLTKF